MRGSRKTGHFVHDSDKDEDSKLRNENKTGKYQEETNYQPIRNTIHLDYNGRQTIKRKRPVNVYDDHVSLIRF